MAYRAKKQLNRLGNGNFEYDGFVITINDEGNFWTSLDLEPIKNDRYNTLSCSSLSALLLKLDLYDKPVKPVKPVYFLNVLQIQTDGDGSRLNDGNLETLGVFKISNNGYRTQMNFKMGRHNGYESSSYFNDNTVVIEDTTENRATLKVLADHYEGMKAAYNLMLFKLHKLSPMEIQQRLDDMADSGRLESGDVVEGNLQLPAPAKVEVVNSETQVEINKETN